MIVAIACFVIRFDFLFSALVVVVIVVVVVVVFFFFFVISFVVEVWVF